MRNQAGVAQCRIPAGCLSDLFKRQLRPGALERAFQSLVLVLLYGWVPSILHTRRKGQTLAAQAPGFGLVILHCCSLGAVTIFAESSLSLIAPIYADELPASSPSMLTAQYNNTFLIRRQGRWGMTPLQDRRNSQPTVRAKPRQE